MRVLAHLSDLHFGKVALETVAPLVEAVHAARPDVTVVSGDFVPWGNRGEFERLQSPLEYRTVPKALKLVVPRGSRRAPREPARVGDGE